MLNNFRTIIVFGALTDTFLKNILSKDNIKDFTIIVNDFSRIFITPASYYKFIRRGGVLQVRQKANLIAICTNPTSPEGYNYNPAELRNAVADEVSVPVYDIIQAD